MLGPRLARGATFCAPVQLGARSWPSRIASAQRTRSHAPGDVALRMACEPVAPHRGGFRALSTSVSRCASASRAEQSATPVRQGSAPPQQNGEPPGPPKGLRLRPYMELARLDKPAGAWFLFAPCTWSIALASQFTGAPLSVVAWNLGLFGVGSLVMRGAGCTINDMWDSELDAKVERTRNRPLAAGTLTHKQATGFLGVQMLAGLGVLLNMNTLTIMLGFCAVLPMFIYPALKRITYWPQAFLGFTFTWGAVIGWTAVANDCFWPAVLPLYASSSIWVIAYDTIYAHQDKVDDKRTGMKSTALLFGDRGTKPMLVLFSVVWLALFAYAVHATSPIVAPWVLPDGTPVPFNKWLRETFATGHPFFGMSWLGAVAHVAWQIRTVDLNNRADCWAKFTSNRGLALILFSGLLLDYLYQVVLYPEERAAVKADAVRS